MATTKSFTWTEFAENTSLHGVKYAGENSTCSPRRILWLVFVLGAAMGIFIQVFIRVAEYYEYNTTVDVQLNYADTLSFPAVTLCSHNAYRMTVAAKYGIYGDLDDMFSGAPASEQLSAIDSLNFTTEASHQLDSMILGCTWNGEECGQENFSHSFTDMGLCYTFNAAGELSLQRTGPKHGLSLILNTEQYEYMKGPFVDAGIKIVLHEPGAVVMAGDQGISLPPGMHTLLAMALLEQTSLPHPYGTCSPDENYPRCVLRCHAQIAREECGCVAPYMLSEVNCLTAEYNRSTDHTNYNRSASYNDTNQSDSYNETNRSANYNETNQSTNHTEQNQSTNHTEQNQSTNHTEQNQSTNHTEQNQSTNHTEQNQSTNHTEQNQSTTCSLDRMYLCVQDSLETAISESCGCVAGCRVVSYDPIMSYAQLSRFSRDLLLTQRDAGLETQVRDAEEVKQRVVPRVLDQSTRLFRKYRQEASYLDEIIRGLDLFWAQGDTPLSRSPLVDTQFFRQDIERINSKRVIFLPFSLSINTFTSSFKDHNFPYDMFDTMNQTAYWLCVNGSNEYHDEASKTACNLGITGNLSISSNVETSVKTYTTLYPVLLNLNATAEDALEFIYRNDEDRSNMTARFAECLSKIDEMHEEVTRYVPRMNEELSRITHNENLTLTRIALVEVRAFLETVPHADISKYKEDIEAICGFTQSQYLHNTDLSMKHTIPTDLRNIQRDVPQTIREFTQIPLSLLNDMNASLESILAGAEEMQNYQDATITMLQLGQRLREQDLSKTIEAQLQSAVGFLTATDLLINQMQVSAEEIAQAYALLLDPGIHIPIFNGTSAKELGIAQQATLLNVTFPGPLTQPEYLMQLVHDYIRVFTESLEIAANNVSANSLGLQETIHDLSIHIQQHETDCTVDSSFYLDNVVHVDVFYKELMWTSIEQQPSFVLLSLLSEVGGFMGLLLGASLLSFFELLDFILQSMLVRCCGCKKEEEGGGKERDTVVVNTANTVL